MSDEWQALVEQLRDRGVAGAAEFGRFVSDTRYFAPSQFDERAAMPVLLDAIPALTDPKVIRAAAAHLRRPWARSVAFDTLAAAFETWRWSPLTRAGRSAIPSLPLRRPSTRTGWCS